MKVFVLLLFLTSTCTLNAATINSESCSNNADWVCITSIENIDVLGSRYDMVVLEGTFDDLFPNPASNLTFWGDFDLALEAARSIQSILNDSDPVPSSSDTRWLSYNLGGHLLLPYLYEVYSGPQIIGRDTPNHFDNACIDINVTINIGNCVYWAANATNRFASFTPAVVPLPAAAWLFGTAILGLVGVVRRRKA